jgi:hypothetical protein
VAEWRAFMVALSVDLLQEFAVDFISNALLLNNPAFMVKGFMSAACGSTLQLRPTGLSP